MPKIEFSFKDFQKLVGRSIKISEMEELLLLYAKAEADEYDAGSDVLKVDLDDTNLPYLWSVEGMARFFQGLMGVKKGLAPLKTFEGSYQINIEPSVKKIRPYIATFVADGAGISEYLLQQLIQLQEKFCEGYGRRRQKVSIGLYSHKRITFPVSYKAVAPDSLSFTPLEMKEKMTLSKVLELHPKGKQYGWILKDLSKYPVLVDDKGEVLSLVPIINSSFTGKLEKGDVGLLFEATGKDYDAVNLAANIFAQNLYERGYKITRVKINEGDKEIETPKAFGQKIELRQEGVRKITGLDLDVGAIKSLLEKGRYGMEGNTVLVPEYRRDILHEVDVIEDVAIMYGFNNMPSEPISSYTRGHGLSAVRFSDKVREIAIGLGLIEVLSPILSNKEYLETRMNVEMKETVEIENVMSETYSAVRSWMTPVLLEVLSKNKHHDYPQRIFEEGIVTRINKGVPEDRQVIGVAVSHTNTDFTEIKQVVEAILRGVGVRYKIVASKHPSFIPGRMASVVVNGKEIGELGEIDPKVLINWELEMPVATAELNLGALRLVN